MTEISITREPARLVSAPFQNRRLIAVDGDPGAGKSTLAREIRDICGGSIIGLDDFLCRPRESFISQYRASTLLDHFSATKGTTIIVEGVVVLDALEFLRASPDYMVFATRRVDGTREYEDFLAPDAPTPKASATREIVEYYRRREPWLSADLETTLFYSTRS